MKFFLILSFLSIQLFSNSLTTLQKYKETHPAVKSNLQNIADTQQSNTVSTSNNKLIIHFKNVEQTNFVHLYEYYKLDTLFCFAQRICVFENHSSLSLQELIEILKKDPNVLSVKEYKQYKMRPF